MTGKPIVLRERAGRDIHEALTDCLGEAVVEHAPAGEPGRRHRIGQDRRCLHHTHPQSHECTGGGFRERASRNRIRRDRGDGNVRAHSLTTTDASGHDENVRAQAFEDRMLGAPAGSVVSMRELAELLVARRKALRLSQQDVADAIGISRRSVHAIERGKPTVEVENVFRMCAALGLVIEVRR